MPIITPDGKPADSIDKTMLMSMWSKKLAEEKGHTRPYIISAAMGKPTFPISQYAAQSGVDYWSESLSRSRKARFFLNSSGDVDERDRIAKMYAAIDYGDPRGDFAARTKMAKALTRWYGDKAKIGPQNILYTTGGAGALHSIFVALNKRILNALIVTPFPHYSLYSGPQKQNRLFPVPVMKEKGYRLTANLLSKHLKVATDKARKENKKIGAILICDPNNPLGTALDKEELQRIANVLKDYPDVFIILDEAYAEMRLNGEFELSLLAIAPELKNRMIIMRSATKALSAAGERMAIIIAFDDTMMTDLIQENVNTYGHAPRSLQYVYAEAMEKLGHTELENLRNYYKPQVEYGLARLEQIGANMPKSDHYHPDGTFYILSDLKDLFGQEISADASRALGKRGKITNDEELVYSLLFDNGIALAPLSYFGISNKNGYVRITCSGGEKELAALMDRLECRLVIARKEQQKQLEQDIQFLMNQLNEIDQSKSSKFNELLTKIMQYQSNQKNVTALTLKKNNQELEKIKKSLSVYVPKHKHDAAVNIQVFFRGYQSSKRAKELKSEMDDKWRACINYNFKSEEARQSMYKWPPSKRLTFQPWLEYLRKNDVVETVDATPYSPILSKL